MLLTAEMLLNYQRCSRRVFLDTYGKAERKDAISDYVLKLFQDSAQHHKAVLGEEQHVRPSFSKGKWQEGTEATQALMAQGVDRIYQGVLWFEEGDMAFLAVPDLLLKVPGHSIYGDWLYMPVEIKLSKRAKTEYQTTLAYHVKVLAQIQGAWPEEAWLQVKDRANPYIIDLWEMLPRMEVILEELLTMLRDRTQPEVFISRNRCSLCQWYGHCYETAIDQGHLSLLPGVTQTRYKELVGMGVTTLEELAQMPARALELTPGFGLETGMRLVRQAQATLHNQALPGDDFPRDGKEIRLWEQMVPTHPVELYFDVESEPSLDLIYLHGVLVVDRLNQTQTFHSLLGETVEAEPIVWQKFLDLVWAYPTAPIFHFCPYEVQVVGKLAKLYGTPEHLVQPLYPRFVDLHDRITRLATLPIENYALKNIARWMGFDWRDANANGAQSIYWYAQWLETGDRAHLEAIVTYNEDDCRATHHIKEWIVVFLNMAAAAQKSANLDAAIPA
jgi:predicted RecB family nuclease